MAVQQGPEGGPARSTGAFPMPPQPVYKMVEAEADYAKSTGAFPMYDARNAPERVAEHIDAPVTPSFNTPGPQSYGTSDVAKQRAELGLSDDPSGMSDQGYEARPSTVAALGADGVDREAKNVDGDKVTAKVVEPEHSNKPAGRTKATGK